MRVLLKLREINNRRLAINYNYPLSSAIYKLLRFGKLSKIRKLKD